jgi:TonB family protein
MLGLLGAALVAMATIRLGASANPQASPVTDGSPPECRTIPKSTDPEVTPPRLTHKAEPKVARKPPSPVYVCLEVGVQTDGTPGDLKVIESGGAEIDSAVLEVVREWRWLPAKKNGVPIPYAFNVLFTVH